MKASSTSTPEPLHDQVVGLGNGQLGRDERLALGSQHRRNSGMARFVGIGLGVQRAGIHDERHQRSPIDFSYSSSDRHRSTG